jgi:cell shape-determining protein MreC
MTTVNRTVLIVLGLACLSLLAGPNLKGQSPQQVVVQAANATASTAANVPKEAAADSTAAALKSLQELKKTNDEILSKQLALLQQLDELQQNAEQLKIFANRG